MFSIGVIANQNSKLYRVNPGRVSTLEKTLGERGIFRATNDIKDLEATAILFKSKNIDILAISGGDGTCALTLTKFIEVYGTQILPKIALLRGGTMNTTAASLKIKGSPEKILKDLLSKLERNEDLVIAERNILKVNNDYGFIFGNGFFHNFLKIYYERAYPSVFKGFCLLSRAVISAAFNLKFSKEILHNFQAEMIVDGKKIDEKIFLSINCATIPYIGFGFNPYPKVLKNKDKFHLLGFPPKPFSVAKHMPEFFLGKELSDTDFIDITAGEVIIETKEPQGYQLDGDLKLGGNTIILRAGPRLKFIVG